MANKTNSVGKKLLNTLPKLVQQSKELESGIQNILKYKVTLPHVKIVIKGLGTWDINKLNDTYDTMPKTLKNHFEKQKIWIQIYIDASREDLSDIFERVNFVI